MEKSNAEYRQKGRQGLGSIRKAFSFEDENLTYIVSDNNGEKTLTIPYETINFQKTQIIYYKNSRYRARLMLICLLLCFIEFVRYNAYNPELKITPFLIMLAVGSIGIYFFTRGGLKYTILESGSGPLYIIQDKQHDDILQQLKSHWIAVLRKKYMQANPANSPEQELARFDWLKKNEVITEQEYQDAIKNIQPFPDRGGTKINLN